MSINYFKVSKFLLYLAPLAVVLVTSSTLFPFIVGKYAFFRTIVDLALIFFLLGMLFQKNFQFSIFNFKFLKSPLVIAVSVFILIFVLAGFFGVNPVNSFWSNFERGEGGIQLIHLWLFFILLAALFKDEKDWQRILVFSLIGGLGMAFYGLLAASGVQGFIGGKFSEPGFRFSGSIGNPAYTAAYSIFMLFYAAYLAVGKYRQRLFSAGALALYGLMIIFFAVFLLAATRGAFMGLIAAVLAVFVYLGFSIKKWRKWFLTAIIFVALAVGTTIYFKDTAFVKSIPGSRIFDISFSAQTWQHRTIMWKIAWDGFKERPILGWGPENYLFVFDRHFNTSYFKPAEGFGAWFDRAHSVYFDYLAETGILGLLSFLGIWIVFYWQLFKSQKEKLPITNALLFALPVAYLVQGIVLFDVLPIYINVFLMLAFANYKFNQK